MARLTLKIVIMAVLVLALDHAAASFLKNGLDKRFRLDRGASVLCVGNSHTVDGIDEQLLENGLGVPVAKYSYRGFTTFDRLAMIQQYVSQNPGTLRLVIYDVDDHTFTCGRQDMKTYTNLYPFMGNSEINRHIMKSAGSWGEYASRRCLWMLRYSPDLRNFALGAYFNNRNIRSGKVSVDEIMGDIAREGKEYGAIRIEPDNTRCFEEIIRFVRSQGAVLAFVYIPVTDLWNAMVDKERHRQAVAMLERYASQDSGVILLNYKEAYEHKHELFYDRTHMNIKGRELLTRALLDDIKPYVK